MHTVELLEVAIDLAKQCGFVVREDWFGGAPAGACECKGRRWIFLDLALSPAEKLNQVLDGLCRIPIPARLAIDSELQKMVNLRKAA